MDPKLYDLINKLYEKIEVLERKIDRLSLNPNEVDISRIRALNGLSSDPHQNFEDWLTAIQISPESVTLVTSNIPNAFKSVVKDHVADCASPIYKNKNNNKLYVYDKTNTWVQWTDENLNDMVREIWRKFMKFHIEMTYDHEELYLAQRKEILDMRRKLLDVKKNKNDLGLWLRQII
jgi:hypothetical protein